MTVSLTKLEMQVIKKSLTTFADMVNKTATPEAILAMGKLLDGIHSKMDKAIAAENRKLKPDTVAHIERIILTDNQQ